MNVRTLIMPKLLFLSFKWSGSTGSSVSLKDSYHNTFGFVVSKHYYENNNRQIKDPYLFLNIFLKFSKYMFLIIYS